MQGNFTFYKNLTAVFLFTLVSMAVNAQGRIGSVKGIIKDTAVNQALASATINVLDGKDSSLVTFARSKEDGSFSIAKLDAGSYVLLISYTGFSKVQKGFTVSADKPAYDFGTLPMTSLETLKDVVVTAAPIVIKGDTIEYNAGSFKVNKPNAVVEDLLKKLPGVEVAKDGTITTNGQEVKRILVDGKPFFANDPKLATKNLQADMVNKVQVFDKKSDKSEFTGFDDGNSEPTINLTLKADKRNGVFGKVAAGGGTDVGNGDFKGRYQANANVNSFKKGEQLSLIGQANNVNQQGFGLMDALSFGGGPAAAGGGGAGGLNISGTGGGAQGITATQAVGANYNNFKNSKLDFTSSYFFNGTETNNDYNTERRTLTGDSTQFYNEPGYTTKKNYNNRLNLGLDWKIDTFNSIKITPTLTYQNTNTATSKTYSTTGPKGGLLTDGNSNTQNDSRGYNFSTTALWRHRFAKNGRTFSTELKYGRNQSDGDGSQYTLINTFLGNGNTNLINQQNTSKLVAGSYSANVSYTEPLSKRSLMEFNAYHNHNDNTQDKRTYDYDSVSGDYNLINKKLTNYFDNDYNYTGAGISFKENRKGWNYMIGTKFQRSELSSLLQGKTTPISQTFYNVLPTAQLQISQNRYRNFRVNYNGSTTQPSVSQLQPVEDISDPLNITRGNPNLKQSFSNNLRVTYNTFDPYTMKSFFIFITGKQTFNAIANNDSIGIGSRRTTYANVDGVYNLNANMALGLPLTIGAEKAKINFSTYASYGNNVNLLNDLANKIKSLNLSERVSVNYTFKELFDIALGGGVNWNNAKYSLQADQNTNYFAYTASFDFNAYLPGGFTAGTDVDYTANTGRANGYNTKFTLWNAYVSKSFLKNKRGEIKFSINDILNQNTGISRNSNANYIEDTRYTVLKRYAMLTFTYSLSKFGGIGGGGGPRVMMMGGPRG
jgi:hypothetical protein